MHYGKRLKQIVEEKGLSVQELCSQLNVKDKAVYKMFRQEGIGKNTLDKYLKAAGVTFEEFINPITQSIPKSSQAQQNDVMSDSITRLVNILEQQAEAILKNSNSIENQTIVIKQNAITIEAQRSQIAELSNKGIRNDISVLQDSVNELLKDKIQSQKKKNQKKAG